MDGSGLLRIGELSRRSGVSPELLRAWERRYQLLRPARSQGGLRLYSLEDMERVRLMQQHLARGHAAAEAAALANQQQPAASGAETLLTTVKDELAAALSAFDPSRASIVDGFVSDIGGRRRANWVARNSLLPCNVARSSRWGDSVAVGACGVFRRKL